MYELYSGTPISLGAKIQKNFVCYAKGLKRATLYLGPAGTTHQL